MVVLTWEMGVERVIWGVERGSGGGGEGNLGGDGDLVDGD